MESKKILKIDPGKPAAFGVVYYSTGPGGAGDYILSIVRAGARVTVRVRVRVRVRFRVRTRMPVDRGIIDYTRRVGIYRVRAGTPMELIGLCVLNVNS